MESMRGPEEDREWMLGDDVWEGMWGVVEKVRVQNRMRWWWWWGRGGEVRGLIKR